jgi:hypothetical protein
MKTILIPAILASLLIFPALAAAQSPTISQTELVRRTQQLVDAFAPGDRVPWKLYLADDAIFFDEQGKNMDKVAFLAALQPLPAGYTGSIKVMGVTARFAAGAAILSYDADETETVYGQKVHARYHVTDTWVYRESLWKIIASQTLRYYEDPAKGTVAESLLNDYAGTYELAPGHTMTVTQQAGKLYAQRDTGKPVEMLPESPDLFFRAGVEGRRLFHRDASGRVDSLIDRRNNEDLLWKRVQ